MDFGNKEENLISKKQFVNFINKYHILIGIVLIVAFIFRFVYFEPKIPLTFDSLGYFFYALDTSVLGYLPPNYTPANNGWPIFLSVFFSLSPSEDVFSYMQMQKLLSITLSSLTVIPIYFLCRTFFNRSLSIFGAALFAIEPRIIQNSILGVTEPLYILLGIISLVLFLNNKKMIYVSFAIVALTSIVRAEALLLLIPYSTMYFIKNGRNIQGIPKYMIAMMIVILILIPITTYTTEILGHDGLTSRFIGGASDFSKPSQYYEPENNSENNLLVPISNGVENFSKFLVWDLIPIFIFFVPIGSILIFKNLNYKTITIIFTCFTMAIPAFFAYSYPHLDTRYLYFIYPIFCFVSLFSVNKLISKVKLQNILLIIILGIMILTSSIFLIYKNMDTEHEIEAYLIAEKIAEYPKVINEFYPEDHYLEPAVIPNDLETLKSIIFDSREKGISLRTKVSNQIEKISTDNFNSIKEFIIESEKKGITHIVVDNQNNRHEFLTDVFLNEKDFPYLIKEYDSSNDNLRYHVKMFKIDYTEFNLFR